MTAPCADLPRDAAVARVRDAERIFIAYAHSDLKQARDVRRRLLALRGDRDPSSVFLDQDSLLPGEDVSPERVDERLRAASLMVVLCGENTTRGTEVMREIELGVQLRAAGTLQLLPVLLRPHVRMPGPIDYRVQGIFLANLFPAIRYVRWAVGSAVAVLVVVAAVLALGFVDANHRQEREQRRRVVDQTQAKLALFRTEPRSPVDLSGRRALAEYLSVAASVGAHDTARDILGEMVRYPEGDSRRVISHQGRAPVGLVCRQSSVVVAYPDALLAADAGASAATEVRTKRGRFVDLRRSADGQVYAEVEYDGFAEEPDDYDDVDEVRGKERDIYRLSANDDALAPVARSRRLVWRIGHDFDGDEHGPSWWELDAKGSEDTWSSVLAPKAMLHWESQLRKRYSPDGRGVEVVEVGRSRDGRYTLYDVAIHINYDTGQVEDAYHVFAVLARPDGTFAEVTKRHFYSPGARALFMIDAADGDYPSSERPRFLPAAVDDSGHTVVLGQRFFVRPTDSDAFAPVDPAFAPSDAAEIRFTTGGRRVVLRDVGGSLHFVDGSTGEVVHAFLRPPGADLVSWCSTGDGETVAVLYRGTRGLQLWRVTAFAPDGWARRD